MNAKHFILGALLLAAPALAQMQQDETRRPRQEQGQMDQGRMMQPLTRIDKDVMKDLFELSTMHIELGRIAEQQGSHEGVKKFGRTMIDDHTQVLERLTRLGERQGLSFQQWEEDIRKDVDKKVEKYSKMSAAKFDRQYLTQMVKDHDKAINLINRRQDQVSAQLQPVLTEVLPVLRRNHLEAQRLLDEVKGDRRGVGGAGMGDYEHEKKKERMDQ